ncbi:MBL fold metallo-hydrolase [Chitinophaga ginsengisegetis]|uniref:MBL fold metallo-hydrolase n=1 Tax=Chitinophaga ginsengisegetis TaxID=393003 RepID=UPI00341458EE
MNKKMFNKEIKQMEAFQFSVPSGHMNFQLGHLNIIIVTDGIGYYDKNCFAPGIARGEVNQLLDDHYIESEYFELAHNILVIQTGDRTVLIDAGNGDGSEKSVGRLPENLLHAGISLQSVTDIVLTHAHPDHINGLINKENTLVFPHADVHLSKTEYNFWMSAAPDFSKSKNTIESCLFVQQQAKDCFTILGNQLKLFNEAEPLFDFLTPVLAPGHTPGHCMFAVSANDEMFIHMADIVHDEIILFSNPHWGTIFDIDFELAATTRKDILDQFARSRQRVFSYHLPWPGFGYVQKVGNTYKWVQERYLTPQFRKSI